MIVHAAVCVFISVYYTMPRGKSKALFGEKSPPARRKMPRLAAAHISPPQPQASSAPTVISPHYIKFPSHTCMKTKSLRHGAKKRIGEKYFIVITGEASHRRRYVSSDALQAPPEACSAPPELYSYRWRGSAAWCFLPRIRYRRADTSSAPAEPLQTRRPPRATQSRW